MELRPYNGGGGPVFHDFNSTIAVTGAGKLRIMPGLELRTGHSGATTLAAAPGTFEFAGGVLLVNGGNAVTNTGTLDFAAPTLAYGNQLTNQGTLHLAAIAGANADTDFTLAHTGAPTLAASSRILIDVNARPNAPTQWGRYGTSGAITLAGTLQINFGALTPVSGDRWKVVQFPARTGTFSSVIFANVPAGFIPSVTYTATAVEVVLTAGTSMTYAAWTAAQSFPVPADALPNADPDKDGLDNLTEAALGLNPRSAASAAAGTPSFVTTGSEQFLTLQFTRPAGVQRLTDITYHGERSTTLTGWTETGVVLEIGPVDAQGMETITVRDTTPFTAGARSLLRLRFTTP